MYENFLNSKWQVISNSENLMFRIVIVLEYILGFQSNEEINIVNYRN